MPGALQRMGTTSSRKSGAEVKVGEHKIEHEHRAPPVEGSLAEFPLAELLHACSVERTSGALRLRCELIEKVIFLLDGRPTNVESELRSETLGAYLRRTGTITEIEHRMVFELMRQTGKRQGDLLVEHGILTPHQVYEALEQHVTEKVVSCFAWEDGEFEIGEGKEWSPHMLQFRMEPGRIILDGIERHATPNRLGPVTTLSGRARTYLLREQTPIHAGLRFTTLEARFRGFAAQGLTLEDIVWQSGLERGEALKILYGMYLLEILGFEVDEAATTFSPIGGGVPAPVEAEEKVSPEVATRAEAVMRATEQLANVDHFDLLGVGRDAGTEEVETAYKERLAAFRSDLIDELPREAKEAAEELLHQMKRAHRVLSEPRIRAGYLEWQKSGKATAGERPSASQFEADDLCRRARDDLDDNDPTAALEKLRKARQLKPAEPLFQAWLGYTLFLVDPMKNRKKAELVLEKARRVQPDMPEPYLFMARIYEHEKDIARAARLFAMAKKKAPSDVEIAREAQVFSVRARHGRTRKLGGGKTTFEKDTPLLDRDVGDVFKKLFKK